MKNFFLTVFLFFTALIVFAQSKSDSLAYRFERQKINTMLANRTAKFGQYDQSLNMHTGIFGIQSKKDIRRSNDILADIVKTDDDIYKEIKVLLDLRTFQKTQAQSHSKEIEDRTLGYMQTINKLRNQLDLMKAEAEKQQQRYNELMRNFIIAIGVAALAILLLFRRKKKQVTTKRKSTRRKSVSR
jgi:hypothetical protein